MSKYVLVKGDFDYADEFGCECFMIGTEEEWKEIDSHIKGVLSKLEETNKIRKKLAKPTDYIRDTEIEIYFGTNEQLTFCSYENFKQDVKVVPITEKEYEFLLANFGSSWGTASGVFELERWNN